MIRAFRLGCAGALALGLGLGLVVERASSGWLAGVDPIALVIDGRYEAIGALAAALLLRAALALVLPAVVAAWLTGRLVGWLTGRLPALRGGLPHQRGEDA